MKIDAHQHFWRFDPVRDSWITNDMEVIQKDFLPSDLQSILKENSIDGCVAIQADQSEKETEFLLCSAEKNSWIKGVVGWLDLLDKNLLKRLEYYKNFSAFKGVRHILQAESDGFMTNTKFIEGVSTVGKMNLTYDILTTESQLQETIRMIEVLPEMRLVIDHISKPNIKQESFEHWAKYMKEISRFEHVHVKLSGMVTEADWGSWTVNQLHPYVDFCLEHIGPARLMFGSDWPVCLLAGDYKKVYNAMVDCLSGLSETERKMIFGETAVKFYNLT